MSLVSVVTQLIVREQNGTINCATTDTKLFCQYTLLHPGRPIQIVRTEGALGHGGDAQQNHYPAFAGEQHK